MGSNLNERLDTALQAKWISRQVLLRKLLREMDPRAYGSRGPDTRKSRGITPEQYLIITILHAFGHGVTVKEISEEIDMPYTNVTRTLDRLELKGVIRRKRGDDDRRQVIVRLTLEGSKMAQRLTAVREDLLTCLWSGLDDQEKRMLALLLTR